MIVITGASDGLGLQLAKLFKQDGSIVVNVSRTSSEVADYNILHNLREGTGIEEASKEILAIDEPLEALVNCAGVFSAQPLGEITEDEIKRVMSSNVKPAILLVSNLFERIKHDGTDIVNVSSIAGEKAFPDKIVYGASKYALSGFSADLQTELKDTKCRVITVSPGSFDTEIVSKAVVDDYADKNQRMPTAEIARIIKCTIDLPKSMEVSKLLINRKSQND